MKHASIYIVDDSLTIRAMMQSLVEQDDSFEVCGLAADVEHALEEIAILRPDVVLLDLALREGDGFAFLDSVQEQIHDPWHAMKVIVVSSSAKRDSLVCTEAFERGAVACFDKSCVCAQSDVLLKLLHDVRQDDIPHAGYPGSAVILPDRIDRVDEALGFMPPPLAPRLPDVLTFI